jgi:hypothetical protein
LFQAVVFCSAGLPVLASGNVSATINLAANCAPMITRRNFVWQRYMLDAMKRGAWRAAVSTGSPSPR